MTYQNKIFDLTLLLFIMVDFSEKSKKKFFELFGPKYSHDKKKRCQIQNFVLVGHPSKHVVPKRKLIRDMNIECNGDSHEIVLWL